MKSSNHTSDFKQRNALFRIKGLNKPWREVAHLGIYRTIPRLYGFYRKKEDFFYLLTQGSLRLSGLASNGKERVIMYMEPDCIFGELVHIHKSQICEHGFLTIDKSKIVCFAASLLNCKTWGRATLSN